MPNAAARRARKSGTVTVDETVNETPNGAPTIMSTLTAGDFQVEELGEDYEFTRSGAGRKREPSPFDDHVNAWAGKGTRRIPVGDEAQGREVIKHLQKACEYRERGLTKRIEDMDGQLYVVFKVNEQKAARAPRKPRGESAEVSESAVEAAETE